jgi:hypothetical protein
VEDIMKKVGIVLFIVALWAGAVNAAQDVIGVNFGGGDDGLTSETADGFSNWTDSGGSNSGSDLEVLGTDSAVTCDWTSSNTWSGGNNATSEEQLYHSYLDDGSGGPDITISGLSAWLNAVGASSYTVRVYQCTDHGPSSGYTFGETKITDGTNVLETLQIQMTDIWTTNNSDMRGFVDSGELTNDTIHIEGYGPPSGGNVRGCIAGFKITAGSGAVAQDPNPVDGEEDVAFDTELTWSPGIYAVTHDVYLGTSFDDVNDASTPTASGLDANSYNPPDRLEFGQTYFWRIDEVNAAPDYTIYKGNIWSFTTEPFVYQIENITATASSSHNDTTGPENTINGSGLNESDQHSIDIATMWLTSTTGPQPSWIQYEFDRAYKLYEMWVWNSNMAIEAFAGLGLKDVTIEYSTDANDWMVLTGVPEFNRATGLDDYEHNTTIAFDGAKAKYVKITATGAVCLNTV